MIMEIPILENSMFEFTLTLTKKLAVGIMHYGIFSFRNRQKWDSFMNEFVK